jgi:RsiW-degrading membrane proteinase PrsW (M82 family)
VHPILLRVDWLTVTALAVLLALMAVALLRSVITRRRRALWLLLVPLALFTIRWALYRSRWTELGLSALLAGVALVVWWLAYGRRLPPPTDDNIRVWTKDDPF